MFLFETTYCLDFTKMPFKILVDRFEKVVDCLICGVSPRLKSKDVFQDKMLALAKVNDLKASSANRCCRHTIQNGLLTMDIQRNSAASECRDAASSSNLGCTKS